MNQKHSLQANDNHARNFVPEFKSTQNGLQAAAYKPISEYRESFLCPECSELLIPSDMPKGLSCPRCKKTFPFLEGAVYFSKIDKEIHPSRLDTDASQKSHWTKWRLLNFEFCKKVLSEMSQINFVLDIGAGKGHFRELFIRYNRYLALDFYPYPGVQIIADFTKKLPLRNDIADLILLSNVLEHSPEPLDLLKECRRLLRPSVGRIIILVPFLIKVHQAPFDFFRYTEYGLQYLLRKAQFSQFKTFPLGNLLDINDLFQAATLKTTFNSSQKRRSKLEFRLYSFLQRIYSKRLKKSATFVDKENAFVLGYGCVASK